MQKINEIKKTTRQFQLLILLISKRIALLLSCFYCVGKYAYDKSKNADFAARSLHLLDNKL